MGIMYSRQSVHVVPVRALLPFDYRLFSTNQVLISQVHTLMTALYRYFQQEASLPDHSGPLSESVSPASIRDANDAVRSIIKRRNKLINENEIKCNKIFFCGSSAI